MARRSKASIRRAYSLGFSARKEGEGRDVNPYSFSAWGLGGPWLVGWLAADREETGGKPEKATAERLATTPLQREVLLEMASTGAWVDLSGPALVLGPGARCYPLRTESTRVRYLHVRTFRKLRDRGYVKQDGRKGILTSRGRDAIPEVRAVRWLLDDPRRGLTTGRAITQKVLDHLLAWFWVKEDPETGYRVTAQGAEGAGRNPKKSPK